MTEVRIKLDTMDKVKRFVSALTDFSDNFDIQSGRYIIDAKSIMGILSLDLTRPLTLSIPGSADTDTVMKAITPFMVTD